MFHDSQIAQNKKTRGAGAVISLRGWTEVQLLMRKRGITQLAVGERCGLRSDTVSRALSKKHFQRMRHGDVMRVRWALNALLEESGWAGVPADLWGEYDALIARVANENDPTPPQAA